ncbi:MAG: TIGR03435 family protein, partial [Bryobacteraceae bacterium]
GGFDFDLTFSREQTADTTSPSVFTAVQEQLGLKLESIRAPVESLVVEKAEKPSEN